MGLEIVVLSRKLFTVEIRVEKFIIGVYKSMGLEIISRKLVPIEGTKKWLFIDSSHSVSLHAITGWRWWVWWWLS